MSAMILDKFERNIKGDSFNQWKQVTIHEFPDGVEVVFDEAHETCQDGALFMEVERAPRGEGDREKSIERGARRAKTQVRRRCKMIQADCMLTLTYRENMQDYERLHRDVKAFVKRIRALGDFEYVLCVEKQDRGALHVHMACQSFPVWMRDKYGVRVKSYNLLRSIWRSVVGLDNGNVDLTRPRGRNSAHRIASYIAKYVSKALEDSQFNKKSYWASKGTALAKPVKLLFDKSIESWDIVSMLAHDFCLRGFTDIVQFHDKMNSFYWFAASRP